MSKKKKAEMEIREFEYYLVVMDSRQNYIISYGYEDFPLIIDIKYAFEQMAKEPDIVSVIPDWKKNMDYASIDIMNHKKFLKYMEKQEKKAQKEEKKSKKKNK